MGDGSGVDGSIDAPAASDSVDPRGFEVTGWAAGRGSAVARVEVTVDGRPFGPAGLGRIRPDVAAALSDDDALLAGFQLFVEPIPAERPRARVEIAATVMLLDGTRSVLPARAVDVAPDVPGPVEVERSTPSARAGRSRPALRTLWAARGLDRGGSQLRMAEVVAHLVTTEGFACTVLTPRDGPLRAELEACGVRVEVMPEVPLDDRSRYAIAVEELAHRFRGSYDLVVGATATSFPAVDAAQVCGIPTVLRIGEAEPLRTIVHWFGGALDPAVEERACAVAARASALWSNSHRAVRRWRAQGWEGRYVVQPSGVPAGATDPALGRALRVDRGVPAAARLLVCAGAVWGIKGQAALVRALTLVAADDADLHLAIVGAADDTTVTALRRTLARHGIRDRVIFEPPVADLGPWWAAADVAVCPSESESLPSVVIEAMAAGLPVLATDTGDLGDVVDDERSGWICGPGDVGALAAGLRRVAATSGASLREMGERARRSIGPHHERATCLRRTVDLLRAAAG